MTTIALTGQGRAPGLYDEQLQRQQQEKALFRGEAGSADRGLLTRRKPERAQGEGEEH